MNITRITISSDDNPDWNGTWTARETKQEMDDLGIKGGWAEYLLDMALDCEMPGNAQSAFVSCPEMTSIEMELPSGRVKIMKF